MYYPAELVLRSYLPDKLEIGMLFVSNITIGVIFPEIEVWSLEEIPDDPESFLSRNGAPIELCIIDENEELLADSNTIGWFDEGEHSDEITDITLAEINIIINDYEGQLLIQIKEDFYEKNIIEVELIENKTVISFIEFEEEEF